MAVRIIKWFSTVNYCFSQSLKSQKYLITNLLTKIIFTKQYSFH